jgi:hypothetical protein
MPGAVVVPLSGAAGDSGATSYESASSPAAEWTAWADAGTMNGVPHLQRTRRPVSSGFHAKRAEQAGHRKVLALASACELLIRRPLG